MTEIQYSDSSALWDFRNGSDERARRAEVYLSFRLEGKPQGEANALTTAHFEKGNL